MPALQSAEFVHNLQCQRDVFHRGALLIVHKVAEVHQQPVLHRFQQVRFVVAVCVQVAGFFEEGIKLLEGVHDMRFGGVHPLRDLFVR